MKPGWLVALSLVLLLAAACEEEDLLLWGSIEDQFGLEFDEAQAVYFVTNAPPDESGAPTHWHTVRLDR